MEGKPTLSRTRLIAWLVVGSAAGSPVYGGDTYLIVERPSALVVYDRYQQSLSVPARRSLGQFVPMRILEARGHLGDELTPCMTVEIGGEAFYLLQDDQGRLSGERSAGRIRRVEGATPLNDTAVVIRDNRIRFESESSGQRAFLGSGEKLARVFAVNGETFVGREGTFGWVTLRPKERGMFWEVSASPNAGRVNISVPVLQDSVRSRLTPVNALLARLFTHFNNELHSQRQPPHWICKASRDTVLCLLEGDAENFQESTAALSRSLSNLVIGTRFTVVTSPGKITFQPR